MNLRLAHTAICVPDVDAATAWYADVLGNDDSDHVLELVEYPNARR